MKEVYLVVAQNPEGTDIAGVFTTKQLAQEAADKANKAGELQTRDLFKDEPDFLRVELEHQKYWNWYKVQPYDVNVLDDYLEGVIEQYLGKK